MYQEYAVNDNQGRKICCLASNRCSQNVNIILKIAMPEKPVLIRGSKRYSWMNIFPFYL